MTDFDRLVSSKAADRTAARVAGRGVHWEPDVHLPENYVRSDTVLPLLPVPPVLTGDARGLIGRRFGRLTVIGYGGKKADGAAWVVRCDCGAQEHRKIKAMREAKGHASIMCSHCAYLERMKSRGSLR